MKKKWRWRSAAPRPAEGSVRNLQELYTVAAGVALAKAMEIFVASPSEHVVGANHSRWWNWPALAAFVATIVPFYHGAMRHLDMTYVEEQGSNVRRGALLADFLWLFIEAGILLGMALQIGDPEHFGWWLMVLLAFDSIWSLAVHFILTSRPRKWTQFKWAVVNVPTALVLASCLALMSRGDAVPHPALLWIIMPIAVLRTIIDYIWSWSFYFPPAQQKP